MFADVYSTVMSGNTRWNNLSVTPSFQYSWKDSSTYIHNPPFLHNLAKTPKPLTDISNAYCLAYFGDSITTDHISPAGNIAKNSPAARYLLSRNVEQSDFNTYGARRGNDEIMARGTFANTRIINKLSATVGPKTTYIPTGEVLDISDAAFKYQSEGHPTIIIAGNEYGSGSSRDWAAKGPYLLGVKVIIAQSFERIHRSNLIGMGILPLEFQKGESPESLGLTGKETFTVSLSKEPLKIGQTFVVKTNTGKEFKAKSRLDTDVEIEYFKHGGILQYVTRKLAAQQA